ncbi:MAG TPA: hypothetical protein VMU84_12900 [Thermoanaerobaculia bacterium]|nr:hypothetical protein [Thermoanaerobaculia bacterium]
MKRSATLFAIALFTSLPMLAQDAPAKIKPITPPDPANAAIFCNQGYALCIKAPCVPIVTRNSDGTYTSTSATCECEFISGWSMGPGDCTSRKPVKVNNGQTTYLVSTYSNYFNATNKTMTCNNKPWAWCYGSPCVLSQKNPFIAICTCPVIPGGASMTLGGGCDTGKCDQIWSAAYPKEDAFANQHFFDYMTDHNLQPPPLPPATACPPSPTSTTNTKSE